MHKFLGRKTNLPTSLEYQQVAELTPKKDLADLLFPALK